MMPVQEVGRILILMHELPRIEAFSEIPQPHLKTAASLRVISPSTLKHMCLRRTRLVVHETARKDGRCRFHRQVMLPLASVLADRSATKRTRRAIQVAAGATAKPGVGAAEIPLIRRDAPTAGALRATTWTRYCTGAVGSQNGA
jgi:hypothetical protein